ncbi:hypothetical protein [Streptomyces sp. A1136]|uniref:hypothetical protein n=1 Tax=Streptomyces sp. A1136 TaxID=2563102 RepID=UPI00109E4C75|nr:hypothetical protein [Streptomyces sp. A1136]
MDNADDTGARRARRTGAVLRRTLAALLLAGVAVACGPDTGSAPARSLAPGTPSAVASAPPSSTPLPGPSASPTASVSASAPASVAVATPSAKPTTKAPAPPPPPSREPTEEPTREATHAAQTSCEIVSNSGNCYKAGQFCRKADVGRETHGANGRLIYCRQDGSQPRWNY